MATVKVVDLISRAQSELLDPSGVRWSKSELLDYFNAAQREVVVYRPDAKTANVSFTCTAGSKQTLPAAALRLLDVVRNTSGKSIRVIDRAVLDNLMPNWHEWPVNGTTAIEHYVYSPLDPKVFYLFPKPTAQASVQIVYSVIPDTVTSALQDLSDIASTVIGLDDTYANAILDYMLYRSYMKDTDYAPSAQKAAGHIQSFANALGVKTKADLATSPSPQPVKPE